jgi:hypothetical protein
MGRHKASDPRIVMRVPASFAEPVMKEAQTLGINVTDLLERKMIVNRVVEVVK